VVYQRYDGGGNPVGLVTNLLNAGGAVTYTGNDFYSEYGDNSAIYPETAPPQFHTVEYDFWQPYGVNIYASYPDIYSLPGNPYFSPANAGQNLFITSVGGSMTIAGYAKLSVQNGYSGVYGYLQQYFDTAYQVTNGVVTTNSAGILSPYGNFFATEPGEAALVTMPDVDTGQRGTNIVYVISLNTDANHDGTMDLSFNGTDATSQNSPMEFWINNFHVAPASDGLFGNPLEHDVNEPTQPDYGYDHITSQRGLENFARLWVCGVPPLPASQGYSVTLSCNAVSGSPAINFYEAETNGGIGYLTNVTVAQSLVGETQLGTISSGNTYTFPDNFFDGSNKYFMFEGAGIGEGQFMLTISQNGNTIAQTSTYIDLHDIKDFFEQDVIQENMSGAKSNWTSSVESVQPAISSDSGDDTNLIVLVHGFNVGDWDWLNDSDTVFKRLYWAGYQGKFASVHWPAIFATLSVAGLETVLAENTSIFNDSEINAYKAGSALTTCLNGLKTRFPNYRLNILAHSQGNAVMSEAIEQGAPFDNYIMTQAAMPASSYDVAAPTDSSLTTAESIYATPEQQPMGYRGVYTNMSQLPGNIVSFYNTNDSVLNAWVADQALGKPDGYANYLLFSLAPYYSYDGTDGWYNGLFSSYLVTDPQESRAMISRSLTQPIGRIGPSDGETQQGVIESTINLATQFGFTTGISEHSAEWTRPIQTSFLYYKQILVQIQPAP
jgi:hypothetical protein